MAERHDAKLEKLRKRIDNIDVSMIKLLAMRAKTVEQIGKVKKKMDVEIHQENRWQEVLKRVKDMAKRSGVLEDQFIEDLWNRIHEESKNIQNSARKVITEKN